MDKIWYRNPSQSEVIGCCGGDEKTNDQAEPTRRRMLKKRKKEPFHFHPTKLRFNSEQVYQVLCILYVFTVQFER